MPFWLRWIVLHVLMYVLFIVTCINLCSIYSIRWCCRVAGMFIGKSYPCLDTENSGGQGWKGQKGSKCKWCKFLVLIKPR